MISIVTQFEFLNCSSRPSLYGSVKQHSWHEEVDSEVGQECTLA